MCDVATFKKFVPVLSIFFKRPSHRIRFAWKWWFGWPRLGHETLDLKFFYTLPLTLFLKFLYYPHQCCGSEIIFSGSGSYLDLNFRIRIRIRIRLVYEKYIRNSDDLSIAKKPDCLEKLI
jgi:hypothetical protein